MTIVIAMKFGDRICVMSDTMITDQNNTRNNVIPGRLKSIVINERLTISYAGLSTQAIDAIRQIHNNATTSTESVIQLLTQTSIEHDGNLEFIICSHESTARLIKISGKNVYEGANAYWIGNSEAAAELSQIKIPNTAVNNLPDYMSIEEIIFRNSFITFMRENRIEGIGGGVIDCLCSPLGHCYTTHASSSSWDTIVIGVDDHVQRELCNKTGMYHYEYNVCSTAERGHAIVGFYLPQAKIGFIYDPIHYDEAMKIENFSMVEFSHLVNDAGKTLSMKRRTQRVPKV